MTMTSDLILHIDGRTSNMSVVFGQLGAVRSDSIERIEGGRGFVVNHTARMHQAFAKLSMS